MGKRLHAERNSAASDDDVPLSAASPAKYQDVEPDTNDVSHVPKMQCSLPPHPPISFSSTNDFDVHYAKEHTNRCSSCGKNFPSAHYLALHIDEHHNPLRESIAAQGERTYACFVEDCDRKCSTSQKRRLHLIDKHMFPKAYNFRIVDQGIDETGSLLLTGQRRRLSTTTQDLNSRRGSSLTKKRSSTNTSTVIVSTTQSASNDGSSNTPDRAENGVVQVDDLEQSFAALRFVPPSVQARQRSKKNK